MAMVNVLEKLVTVMTDQIIDEFSPDVINADRGEILTITGEHFGTFVDGFSTVMFNIGDELGTEVYMTCDKQDFIWDDILHWKETEIQV